MQPDDSASRHHICVKCGAITSRVLKDGAVCTPCFTQGWGRLKGMELPVVEKPEPELYVSRKDRIARGGK